MINDIVRSIIAGYFTSVTRKIADPLKIKDPKSPLASRENADTENFVSTTLNHRF